MSLAVTGIVSCRATQEHGKRALAACAHPSRRTVFIAAGQVVDEIDTRDGALVSRIISDLADPLIRLESSSSDLGHEYVCLISASNELRVWDVESRAHVGAVFLGGVGPRARSRLTAVAATHGHAKAVLVYAQAGTGNVELLHLQQQAEAPGSPALLAVLSPKTAHARSAAVTALATHSHGALPLLAAGTVDGIVTVYWCPILGSGAAYGSGGQRPLGDSSDGGDAGAGAPPTPTRGGIASSMRGLPGGAGGAASGMSSVGGGGGDGASVAGSVSSGGAAGAGAGAPGGPHATPGGGAVTLFAAAVSPDYILLGNRVRRQAGGAGAPITSDAAEPITCLAFHPTLPLLAAADVGGRIVVWRIAVPGAPAATPDDRRHSTLASRDGAVPAAPDGSTRLVTSLAFHASLPRLVSVSYAPQGAHYPPLIQAWCTAHPALPPLPKPTTPALAGLMAALVQDPWAAAVAHVTQPPGFLAHARPVAGRTPLLWLAGRAIATAEVAGGAAGAGAVGDGSDADDGGALFNGEDLYGSEGPVTVLPTLPLLPHGACGIAFGAPVVVVLHAPRATFVTGGEGDGVDLPPSGADSVKPAAAGALDDLLGGGASLAEFAARMTASASPAKVKPGADAAATAAVALTRSGVRRRRDAPSVPAPIIDAAIYVQARSAVGGHPPRLRTAYSLQARPLGAALPGSGAAGGVGDIATSASGRGPAFRVGGAGAATAASTDAAVPAKRVAWLPADGPCGPLMPISISHSPSGRYLLVRFAYVTEADSEAAASAGAPPPPAPQAAPICFDTLAVDVPVSPLCAAVDVALLPGERLLAVRRPTHARAAAVIAAAAAAGQQLEPSDTEYVVSVEALDDDAGAVAAAAAAATAAASRHGPAHSHGATHHGHAHLPPTPPPLRFHVHEPVSRVFVTPFVPPATAAGGGSALPLASAAAAVAAPEPVLLYATRHRAAGDPGGDLTVLRYSAAAFSERYAPGNPHGWAVTNAFTAAQAPLPVGTPGAAAAGGGGGPGGASLKRGVSQYLTPLSSTLLHGGGGGPLGLTHPGPVPIGSDGSATATAPHPFAMPTAAAAIGAKAAAAAADAAAAGWWDAHTRALAACPVDIRPALMLNAGEPVLNAVWGSGGRDTVWADGGVHDDGGGSGEPRPAEPPLTLAEAIATGGPLLAILTPLRLLIASPALLLLVAVPTLAPLAGTLAAGLGSVLPTTAGGDGADWEASALAAPSFGVWRGATTGEAGAGVPLADGAAAIDADAAHGTLALGGGYSAAFDGATELVAAAGDAGLSFPPASLWASPRFQLPAAGTTPLDASASTAGGLVTSTVAAAAAAAARLTSPLPYTRVSDTIPYDDCPDDALSHGVWRSPIVGFVWVGGSTLLFTTASGDVWTLTPLGTARRLCSLEPWVRNAVPLAVTHDALVFASSAQGGGRTQLRTRPFPPLEPLVTGALDHAVTRPKPGGAPAHPVVTALAHTLALTVAVVGSDRTAGGAGPTASTAASTPAGGSGGAAVPAVPVTTVRLGGAAAIDAGGFALAALARDYSFVRDVVVRYAHPHRSPAVAAAVVAAPAAAAGVGGATLQRQESSRSAAVTSAASAAGGLRESVGAEAGVTRVTVAALAARGLVDLAFYVATGVAAGTDRGALPFGRVTHVGAAEEEDDDGGGDDGVAAGARARLNDAGHVRRSAIPAAWACDLALRRGRPDEALWALVAEEPALAAAVTALSNRLAGDGAGGGGSGDDGAHADIHWAAARLPDPSTPLARRLRALGRACLRTGHLRHALLAFDVAGDSAAALLTLLAASVACVDAAAASAVAAVAAAGRRGQRRRAPAPWATAASTAHAPPPKGAASTAPAWQLAELDGALASLAGAHGDRFPATAVLAALRRVGAGADGAAAAIAARAAAAVIGAAAAPQPGRGSGSYNDDDDEEEEDADSDADGDRGSRGGDDDDDGGGANGAAALAAAAGDSAALNSVRFNMAYAAVALGRGVRPSDSAVLPVDYALVEANSASATRGKLKKSAARAVAAAAAARTAALAAHAVAGVGAGVDPRVSALASSPFLCLLDGTLDDAATASAAAAVAAGVGHAGGAGAPAPPVSAVLYAGVVLCGVTVDPDPAPPLPAAHAPLSVDTLQRWVGTVTPGVSKAALALSGGASGGAGGAGDDDDDGTGGDGFGLGVLGGAGGDGVGDPAVFAVAAAAGRARLRPLPRGAEDAVVGYWRFHKSDDEAGAEKAREAELRRAGRWGPRAAPRDTAAGIWGVAAAASGGKPEPLSPWSFPVVDLSRTAGTDAAATLFDATLWAAALGGGGGDPAASSEDTLTAAVAATGPSPLAPSLRLAHSSTADVPMDAGDPAKVRVGRVLVAGLGDGGARIAAAAAGGSGGGAATIPSTVPRVDMSSVDSSAASAALVASGWPPPPPLSRDSPFRALSRLVSWAAVAPLPRYGYRDVGVRPHDPATAAFTLELWARVGTPLALAGGGAGGDDAGDADAEDGGRGGGGNGGAAAPKALRDLLLAARTETSSPAAGAALRFQWTLAVRPDGALVFTAFPFASPATPADAPTPTAIAVAGAGVSAPAAPLARSSSAPAPSLTAPSVVASPPASVRPGEWQHFAVCVDAASAGKEAAARLKAVGAALAAGRPVPPSAAFDAPLPPATVRLLIDGETVATGSVATAMPLPLPAAVIDAAAAAAAAVSAAVAAGTPPPAAAAVTWPDALLLAPDFVGRLAEARLWAKRRGQDEIADGRDFHLDLAETGGRGRMNIQIRPAALPPAATAAAAAAAATAPASSAAPLRRLGALGASAAVVSTPASPPPLTAAPAVGGGAAAAGPPAPTAASAALARRRAGAAAAAAGGPAVAAPPSLARPGSSGALGGGGGGDDFFATAAATAAGGGGGGDDDFFASPFGGESSAGGTAPSGGGAPASAAAPKAPEAPVAATVAGAAADDFDAFGGAAAAVGGAADAARSGGAGGTGFGFGDDDSTTSTAAAPAARHGGGDDDDDDGSGWSGGASRRAPPRPAGNDDFDAPPLRPSLLSRPAGASTGGGGGGLGAPPPGVGGGRKAALMRARLAEARGAGGGGGGAEAAAPAAAAAASLAGAGSGDASGSPPADADAGQ